ncbi:MAG TPA: hypothetical protein VEB86_14950 [Chryseosolibacter sp.]|nr:hypothetical protein [Chryseosolibacter sp.]
MPRFTPQTDGIGANGRELIEMNNVTRAMLSIDVRHLNGYYMRCYVDLNVEAKTKKNTNNHQLIGILAGEIINPCFTNHVAGHSLEPHELNWLPEKITET